MSSNQLYIAKNTVIVLVLLVIVSIAALIVAMFFLFNRSLLANPLEEYKPLATIGNTEVSSSSGKIAQVQDSPSASKKLTVIFFYDGYDSQTEALTAVAVMQEALTLVEPYKSMKNLIDTKVFTTDGKKCKVADTQNILICDKILIESFRKLGTDHFKVVLISPDRFVSVAPFSRGANSWMTISTFHNAANNDDYKRALGYQFTHLLGHSLGLQYEYDDQKNTPVIPPPPQSGGQIKIQSATQKPNCAPNKEAAEAWWGKYTKIFPNLVSFYQGCGGDKNAFYPQRNTLMSDAPHIESYGIVSELYLRSILSCFYAEESSVVSPAASNSAALTITCSDFTKEYPTFWQD